jgi:hypothetical protein
MTRFVVGDDRSQSTLFPERLDDYLGEDSPVRAIDVFVDELDLARLALLWQIYSRRCFSPICLLQYGHF